jgi:hypothetical protein
MTAKKVQTVVTVEYVDVPDQGRRAETLAEVAERVGLVDPDPERNDPVAALFEANRGLIGSDPANTSAGIRLVIPT